MPGKVPGLSVSREAFPPGVYLVNQKSIFFFTDHPPVPKVPLHRRDSDHRIAVISGQCPLQPPSPAGRSAVCQEEIYLQWGGSPHPAQCVQSLQKRQWQQGRMLSGFQGLWWWGVLAYSSDVCILCSWCSLHPSEAPVGMEILLVLYRWVTRRLFQCQRFPQKALVTKVVWDQLCNQSHISSLPAYSWEWGSERVLGLAAKYLDVSHSLQKHWAYLKTDFLTYATL